MKMQLLASVLLASVMGHSSAYVLANEAQLNENEGVIAFNQQKYDQAEDYFLAKIKDSESKNESLVYLSWIYLGRGETTKAIDYIEQALAVSPNNLEELLLSGDIYCNHGQQSSMFTALKMAKKCIGQYEVALAKEPNNVEALVSAMQFYLGAPSFAGGSEEKGNEILTRLQHLSPEDAAIQKIRQLEKDGNTNAAIAVADELVKNGFHSAKNQYEVARYYREKNSYDKALPIFESLTRRPETQKSRWYIHDSLLQQGEILMINKKDLNKTIELISQYKQKNSNPKDIHYYWSSWSLAKAYRALGNTEKYQELVKKIQSENYQDNKEFAKEFEKNR